MASKFPVERGETGQLQTRKGHDIAWSCYKHAEPISCYCKKHKVNICPKCATKAHGQKPCVLVDIEDVISEMMRKLEDTQKRLKKLGSKLESSVTSASNHLQSVNDKVNAIYDEKMKRVKDKERNKIRWINKKADEEIRIINEKRERRIIACKKEAEQEAEKQQKIYKDIQPELLSEIKKIDMTVRKTIEDLKSKHQHEIKTMDDMDSKIKRIKQDDKTLVNEALEVMASLDKCLGSNVHQEVANSVDRIEREVQRVKFVEGEIGGEHYWRIDGYIGKWELVKSIDIPSIVTDPLLSGVISDDEIVLDSKDDHALYVTNISSEHTKKVAGGSKWATSCAPVDSKSIVCGKYGKHITLYDRQWKVIRRITLPGTSDSTTGLYVDVDRHGKILAAAHGGTYIYVINPTDGKTVRVMEHHYAVWGQLQALSSGDIVVKTSDKFRVTSRSGDEKAVIRHKLECEFVGLTPWCYVDKLTDALYITYKERKSNIIAVDQVSWDGKIQAKRIVEYKQSERYDYVSAANVTPSGNLVACDGNKLFLYKKGFIV